MPRRYQKNDDIDDALLVEIAKRFAGGQTPTSIAQWLAEILGREFNAYAVYPQVRRAAKLGFIRIQPPDHVESQNGLAERYRVDADEIHVVEARGEGVRDWVADAAARHVFDLIMSLGEKKKEDERVGIALGGGDTVNRVASNLAHYLRKSFQPPPIRLHALTPGFDVFRPETAPLSSFGYFQGIDCDVQRVGLFAPAAVPAKTYYEEIARHGIAESFEAAKDVDIVITSCACAEDEHGELNRFLEVASEGTGDETAMALREAGWVADVNHCPLSKTGPIILDSGMRAITLFEIDKLVKMVRDEDDKHVVLIAAPCSGCNELKTEALRPLMSQQDKLKLFNHVFMDMRTAKSLLAEGA